MDDIYIKNLLATASNLIGVIEAKQWERLASKTWGLKNAIELYDKNNLEVVFGNESVASKNYCKVCTPEGTLQLIDIPPNDNTICANCRKPIEKITLKQYLESR